MGTARDVETVLISCTDWVHQEPALFTRFHRARIATVADFRRTGPEREPAVKISFSAESLAGDTAARS
ncbi:hypothetical protein [Streptomyces sp. NPDC051636]|uniref:hypothetical protein n=1 Tax=Streptomyces sp. NPDC051636 TaxID=3365663 RepID=UPI0037955A3E